MTKHKISSVIFLLLVCLPMSTMAVDKVPTTTTKSQSALEMMSKVVDQIVISCRVDAVSRPVYAGRLQSIDVPGQVDLNQVFPVTVKITNTGNVPWFSGSSGCQEQSTTYLGTTRDQDRLSVFHAPIVFGETNWYTGNRIKMKTPRVDPGETAEFLFVGHAPTTPGVYREYFAPVVEGQSWIKDQAEFKFDIKVGVPAEEEKILKYTRDILMSLNLTAPEFSGNKKILIDISEQNMYLKLGDVTIKTFRVSTGKSRTPTPIGTTSIQFKQDVRVAASRPHYIMPLFMQFRKGGYGIHALPSLANDRGVFWTEALNHIGSPRSHGCVRLLPDDAVFTYDFADVGTPVQVVW